MISFCIGQLRKGVNLGLTGSSPRHERMGNVQWRSIWETLILPQRAWWAGVRESNRARSAWRSAGFQIDLAIR